MKVWTIEDLRNDKLKSGFRLVGYSPQTPTCNQFYGQIAKKVNGKFQKVWQGPRRATNSEAAQDAADHLNGQPAAAPHPLQVPIPVLDRNDANDLGPEAHERSGGMTKGLHRAEMLALGLEGLEGEFATSENDRKKILGDILQEGIRATKRVRRDGTVKRGRVVVATKVHPARDRRVDADVHLHADGLMVDVEVMQLPQDAETSG